MQTVLIVIHLMIVAALIVVVLLQRSEGGALGMGGGSGGFMTGRGQANVLTRATAILAALFFATSLGLTLLANYGHGNRSILEGLPPAGTSQPGPAAPVERKGTVLDQLREIQEQRASGKGASSSATPAVPSATPSATTPSGTTTAPKAAAPVEPTGMPSTPANQAPMSPKPAGK